jgi:hypothetical protein
MKMAVSSPGISNPSWHAAYSGSLKSLFYALIIIMLPPSCTSAAETNPGERVSSITDILANIPDCVILHYYSSIVLNFEDVLQSIDEGGNNKWKASWTGETEGGGKLSPQNIETIVPNIITVTLPNVWAIRGFSSSGSARVTISIANNRLTSGSSKITIAEGTTVNLEIDDNAGQKGSAISTMLRGIGKSTATIGNVRIPLNFTYTTKSGTYTGGQYKITAETL